MDYTHLCFLIGITRQRFHDWRNRLGVSNRHGGNLPHRNWLTEEECRLIVAFYEEHIEDGYRRCAYMMMDADIVYAKPSTVYKVLCRHGVIRHWKRMPSRKGTGFEQPLQIHEHWHMDITYVHIRGKPYYMITIVLVTLKPYKWHFVFLWFLLGALPPNPWSFSGIGTSGESLKEAVFSRHRPGFRPFVHPAIP